MAKDRLELITKALESGTLLTVRHMLNDLQPAEIARLLECLPPEQRAITWKMVDADNEGEVLIYVADEVRDGLIREMNTQELVAATEGLDIDDLADLLVALPDTVIHEILESMDKQNRLRLESVMGFPEDSAGGLMNTDTLTIRPDVTIDVVLRYLRLKGELPDFTDSLIVVDNNDKCLGLLSLSTLLTADPSKSVSSIYNRDIETILATMPSTAVAALFQDHDLISAPVVDANNKLLGRITIDDVVDIIRDEAEQSILGMAGLDQEDDIFAPAVISAKRRAVWLGINLFTAFLASWVIGLFEATLDQIVALAVLMPIVASMGGVAGTQALTLSIRGLALGQVSASNARWLILKELKVGTINGFIWAVMVGLLVFFWFHDVGIGLVIAVALAVNLMCGALAGFSLPFILRRLGIDPVLAGSVILTTITDVIGFITFLGLGTIYLL